MSIFVDINKKINNENLFLKWWSTHLRNHWMSEHMSTAVNICFSCYNHRKSMLEASYAKLCLAKYSGNSLDMNFEYYIFSEAKNWPSYRFLAPKQLLTVASWLSSLKPFTTLLSFDTYFRSCQLLTTLFKLLICWLRSEL